MEARRPSGYDGAETQALRWDRQRETYVPARRGREAAHEMTSPGEGAYQPFSPSDRGHQNDPDGDPLQTPQRVGMMSTPIVSPRIGVHVQVRRVCTV